MNQLQSPSFEKSLGSHHEVYQTFQGEKRYAVVPEEFSSEDGVTAELEIGKTRFSVVDVRPDMDVGIANRQKYEVNPRSSVEFLVVEEERSDSAEALLLGLKGIRSGETVVLGRQHYNERFQYDDEVSRDHLTITYEEGRLTFEDHSTNGTALKIKEPFTNPNDVRESIGDFEKQPHRAPAYEVVANIFDDEVRADIAHLIENKFFSKEYGEIGELLEEKQRLGQEFEEVAHNVLDPKFREINARIDAINQHLTETYGQKRYEYEDDVETLRSLQKPREKAQERYVIQSSELARGIVGDVLTNASVAEECRGETIFIDPELFNKRFDENPKLTLVVKGEPLPLSVDAIVSAEGFESWEDGRGYGHGSRKEGRTSKDVIDDYATRETDIPSIDDITIYLTPSGEYFAKTNNAHRAAAAKKKGDETIGIKGSIDVVLVEAKPRSLRSGAPLHR